MPTITSEKVFEELKQVFDPEIPVNIVDLGLIYDVQLNDAKCSIRMSLTSQSCPAAKELPDVVKRTVDRMEGIEETVVEVVWEPQWTPQLISAEGRRLLGIEEEE